MTNTFLRQGLSLGLSLALVVFTAEINAGVQQSSAGTGNSAPQSPEQLQALVAPIALYPDSLVAQVLGASTFPDQVAVANYWLQQHKDLTGSDLIQAVNEQTWDLSVKALSQFPSVLSNMANNLSWTSSLGEAYHDQQSEVMAAIQTLRHQAQSAGKLKSGSQITVVQRSPQTIVIEPANPQVVYVPQYDPATIYGYPYVTPGYTAGDVAAAGILGFGAGIAVGALATGGCCDWGWGAWGCNWAGGAVLYNHNDFYGNAAWHGGDYNGGYDHYGYNGGRYHGYNSGYNRNVGNLYRSDNFHNVSGNAVNVNRSGGQNSENRFFGSNSLAHNDLGKSSAFSGLGGHSGGFGNSGGWRSRIASRRGWGSMRAGGFAGGRFGGGRFGGGGFRGGGFRR